MLLSGRSLLGRVALPLLHSVEKLISIRSSACHPDKAGIEFTICLFSLGRTLFRRSLPVNTVLGKEIGTDMDGVVNIVGEMCNLPQLLQLIIQFVEIRHGRSFTDTLEDLLHGSCQPCIHLKHIRYLSRCSFLPIDCRIHILQLMIQTVIFRKSEVILHRLRNVPILHQ